MHHALQTDRRNSMSDMQELHLPLYSVSVKRIDEYGKKNELMKSAIELLESIPPEEIRHMEITQRENGPVEETEEGSKLLYSQVDYTIKISTYEK
jgi:hypothetical protein